MNNSIVSIAERVDHIPNYSKTLTGPEVTTEVFIQTRRSWQLTHQHLFSDFTFDGTAMCQGCGAVAWSEAWVAEGAKASEERDMTHAWADEQYRGFMARAESDRDQLRALQDLAAQANANKRTVALMAPIDADEPASINRRGRLRQEPVFADDTTA